MTSRMKGLSQNTGMVSAALKGTGISLLSALAGGAVISALIVNGKLRETAIGYAAMGILIVSTMVGVIPAVKAVTQKKLIAALGVSGGYLLSLMILNMIFFNGMYDGLAVTGITILCAAMAGFFLSAKPKQKQSRQKRKKRHG